MKTCLISVLILELYRPLCIARVSVGIVSNWMLENAQKSRFSGNYHHSFFHFHSWRFCSLLSPPVCIIFLVCLFLQHYIYTWSVKSHMNVLLSSCTYGQNRYISLDYSIILYCNSIAAKRGGFNILKSLPYCRWIEFILLHRCLLLTTTLFTDWEPGNHYLKSLIKARENKKNK